MEIVKMSVYETAKQLHVALDAAKPHLQHFEDAVARREEATKALSETQRELSETQAQLEKENDALVRFKSEGEAERQRVRTEAAAELRELQRQTNEQSAALDAVTAKLAEATREYNSLVASMQELGLRLRVPAVA
jgi:chromosome segregation ATPase